MPKIRNKSPRKNISNKPIFFLYDKVIDWIDYIKKVKKEQIEFERKQEQIRQEQERRYYERRALEIQKEREEEEQYFLRKQRIEILKERANRLRLGLSYGYKSKKTYKKIKM